MGRDPLHLVSEVQSVDLETAYPKPRYQTKQAKQAAVMEEQIAALANAVNDGRVANEARLDAIWQSLELWRPAVTHLQHQVNELRTQVGRIALHPALAAPLDPIPEGDAVVRPVPAATTDATEHHGPLGHGEIDNTGGQAYGVVTTQLPPPVKGGADGRLTTARVQAPGCATGTAGTKAATCAGSSSAAPTSPTCTGGG